MYYIAHFYRPRTPKFVVIKIYEPLCTLFNNLRDMLSNEGYQRMEQTLQWRVDIEGTMIWQWRDVCVNYSQHITFSRNYIISICILLQTENCIINHAHREYAELQSAHKLHQNTDCMSFIYDLFYYTNDPGPIDSVLNSPCLKFLLTYNAAAAADIIFFNYKVIFQRTKYQTLFLITGTKIFLWCSASQTVANMGIWHMASS
jgi:hypothetical protein